MKAPVRFWRGRIWYTGRIARASFARWAASSKGQSVIGQVASQIRFAILGKSRAARRLVWRRLLRAARNEAVIVAIQQQIDQCLRLDTLACADLPRVSVDLRRLVVVPRLFINEKIYHRIDSILCTQPAFAALEGGESLRTWFVLTLVDGIEASIADARLSPRRPLQAGECWTVVGLNGQFKWYTPIEGDGWLGHYYVLEQRPVPVTDAVRKATRRAIAELDASLASLPSASRGDILRRARMSLERLVTSSVPARLAMTGTR